MTTTTVRQTFRERVALVAAKAKAKLPECNGRVESAVKLVLAGDVFVRDDGRVEVGSCTDPLTMHRLSGASCSCEDFQHGRAPGSWCKHRLAHAIATRVHQEMAPRSTPVESEPEIELPADFEPYPDNDPEETPMPGPTPAPVPLPEAPASVNCHLTIAGRQVQLTLRGVSEDEVLTRLERVLARYPVSTPSTSAEPEPEKRYCPLHGTEMQRNEKEGRSWYSHKTADGWCKGR